MNDVVKLQIKIDGNLKEVEVAADDLADAIKNIKQKTKDLENGLINSNQMVQAFEQVTQAVQGLQSAMHGLTDAYAVQSAAEARLEQMMRNTMDATDDEIQSIKDLAAEQQVLDERGLRGINASDRFYHFVLVFTCVNQIFYTFALSLCETSQTNVGASRAGGR